MSNNKKIIVVACEGQHDIAFITRILVAYEFSIINDKIKDFSFPFNYKFKNIAESMVIADRKLGYQNPNYLLPSVALSYGDDKIVFMHNLSGDGRPAERRELIENYSSLVGGDDFTSDLGFSFRFLFFFDADNIGVSARLDAIKDELNIASPLLNGDILSYGDNNEVGCYIYHDYNSEEGVLEDLLLNYFSNKDDSLNSSINDFFSANNLEAERTKEFVYKDGAEIYKGSSKFHPKKSKLNLFGQLQFSGMNNSVIIAKSDFIRKSDLDGCLQSNAIRDMFL